MKRYSAKISYSMDVIADENALSRIQDNLFSFGATGVVVKLEPWTGAGAHEWVKSAIPGLDDLILCIKCRKDKDTAAEECPGIPKPAANGAKK